MFVFIWQYVAWAGPRTLKYKLPVCDTFLADCAYKIISIKLNFLYSKIGTDVPSHMGRGTSVPRVLFSIFLIISLTHYLHNPNYLYFDVPGVWKTYSAMGHGGLLD